MPLVNGRVCYCEENERDVAPAKVDRMQYSPIGKLTPSNNPRVHPESQVAAIAGSIRRFGFNAPIVVDEGGRVLAGHGRLEAAKLIGLETVPTVVAAGLTETQKRAYLLADNELAGSWDDEMLSHELDDLGEFLSEMGFEQSEYDALVTGWDSDIEVPAKPEERGRVVLRCPQEGVDALAEWLNTLDFPVEVEL